MEKQIREGIWETLKKIREEHPAVPSITSTVTQEFVANSQLAVGGSAAMIYLTDEGETVAKNFPAFYMNFGTVFPFYEESVPAILKALNENKTPFVLDPVGIGLGELRTILLSMAKDFKPAIIRGNASEIMALAKLWNLADTPRAKRTRFLESDDKVSAAKDSANALAKFTGGAVAVSGADDLIVGYFEDKLTDVVCPGGSELLTKITGAGCSLGGMMGICAAVAKPFIAALTATVIFNRAAEYAERDACGPGTFRAKFLDGLYKLTPDDVAFNSTRDFKLND